MTRDLALPHPLTTVHLCAATATERPKGLSVGVTTTVLEVLLERLAGDTIPEHVPNLARHQGSASLPPAA